MDLGALGAALVAAFVIERLVEALVSPVWDKFALDRFWLLYVAWFIGSALAWATAPSLCRAPWLHGWGALLCQRVPR